MKFSKAKISSLPKSRKQNAFREKKRKKGRKKKVKEIKKNKNTLTRSMKGGKENTPTKEEKNL